MKKIVFLAAAILLCAAPSMAQNVKLKTARFEDGTGSIGLAPGWEVDGVYNGAVQCTGPNGAAIVLKMPWTIMVPGSLPGLDPGSTPVAPVGNIDAALRQVMTKKLGATLLNVRGRRLNGGGAPAYLLQYEYKQNGQTYAALGYFASLGYGNGQPVWQLYSSAVVAPKAQFVKMLPQMLAMWKSWHPNGQPPIDGSASKIFDDLMTEKRKSYEKIQEAVRGQL